MGRNFRHDSQLALIKHQTVEQNIMNNHEVAHRWANDSYTRSGDLKGNNMYAYEHSREIFSYGDHFCIAKKTDVPGFPILFTHGVRSNSTTRHVGHVGRAIAYGTPIFRCADPSSSPLHIYCHELGLDLIHRLARWSMKVREIEVMRERIAKRASKGKPSSDTLEGRLNMIECEADSMAGEVYARGQELEAFRRAFKITLKSLEPKVRALRLKFLNSTWHDLPDQLDKMAERAEKKREELRKKLDAELLKKEAENLIKWLAGENVPLRYQTGPAKLRVVVDAVETSQGANVPIGDAWKLWKLVGRMRRENKEFIAADPPIKLGHYPLSSITSEGSVVIGCHRIHYDEMERIAPLVRVVVEGGAA